MPSKMAALVTLQGSDEYARFLDRLLKAVRAAGATVASRHQLAEHALALLGVQHGLKVPPRARPVGTNRFGEPKADG